MKNVTKKSKDSLPVFTYAVQLSDGIGTKWDNGKGNCL